jgi:hypothetical protein
LKPAYLYAIFRASVLIVGLAVASEIVLVAGRNIPLQVLSAAIALAAFFSMFRFRYWQLKDVMTKYPNYPKAADFWKQNLRKITVLVVPVSALFGLLLAIVGISIASIFIGLYLMLALVYFVGESSVAYYRYESPRPRHQPNGNN